MENLAAPSDGFLVGVRVLRSVLLQACAFLTIAIQRFQGMGSESSEEGVHPDASVAGLRDRN